MRYAIIAAAAASLAAALAPLPAAAQLGRTEVPFAWPNSPKSKAPPPSPAENQAAVVSMLLQKQGYHRLPGSQYKNARDRPFVFNVPAGENVLVALPGSGCSRLRFAVSEGGGGRALPVRRTGPGLAVFMKHRDDADMGIALADPGALCWVTLVMYQR